MPASSTWHVPGVILFNCLVVIHLFINLFTCLFCYLRGVWAGASDSARSGERVGSLHTPK
jgi:hypothetical protein